MKIKIITSKKDAMILNIAYLIVGIAPVVFFYLLFMFFVSEDLKYFSFCLVILMILIYGGFIIHGIYIRNIVEKLGENISHNNKEL